MTSFVGDEEITTVDDKASIVSLLEPSLSVSSLADGVLLPSAQFLNGTVVDNVEVTPSVTSVVPASLLVGEVTLIASSLMDTGAVGAIVIDVTLALTVVAVMTIVFLIDD